MVSLPLLQACLRAPAHLSAEHPQSVGAGDQSCSSLHPASASLQNLSRKKFVCVNDEVVPSATPQGNPEGTAASQQVWEWRRAGLVALAAAAVCFTSPALAYKGGGPYGIQVTRGQDLSGQDFSGKTLIKQDFKTSILRQANFKGAKLLGASFFDADLTGADLSDADLRGADFSLAQVQKANLSNANLEGALVTGNTSFRYSDITGADFTDVYLREDQKEYLCKAANGVNPVTGNATRDTLLCDD